jgi:hypothetical protein
MTEASASAPMIAMIMIMLVSPLGGPVIRLAASESAAVTEVTIRTRRRTPTGRPNAVRMPDRRSWRRLSGAHGDLPSKQRRGERVAIEASLDFVRRLLSNA